MVRFALVTLIAAVAFSLLAYALRLAAGRLGTMLFLLFLVLQLAALGNVIPIETAPSTLQRLNGLLPLTAYINAASQLVSGGRVGSVQGATLVLVLWGLVAWTVVLVVVKRRRLVPPTSSGRRDPARRAAQRGVSVRRSRAAWALLAVVLAVQCVFVFSQVGRRSTSPHDVRVVVQGPAVVAQEIATRVNHLAGHPLRASVLPADADPRARRP